jgi:hypothetical protein
MLHQVTINFFSRAHMSVGNILLIKGLGEINYEAFYAFFT